MNDLIISQRKDSLGVECLVEDGLIKMEGTSYPENSLEFFNPIFYWLNDYIENIKKKITLEFRIDYLNSSSIKCIMELLDEIEKYQENGGNTKVKWYYQSKDINMYEIAEELLEDLAIPYEIIVE